ncbi:serine/Threonine protein kinase and Signal Transduction Histidine Kinase (STHK) with GAF sensor [Richelia sinica FACHB-800]|uniref:histidine kinase n=1 Tax=Richelia sinica FACHB-800 TaxID=1357546 RepID=A0A975TCC4_9NOST|nr:ATP-binding sensor histidine kinase [Richelia sinica]MBD2667184.1 AAA family ATPase [Richelia sinica FACHB-800]QXE25850.1 serine/Threonine protein kinase and Signal Transduction Histidine Kinase (STHK) with GAF sensor [Richelia sinica FACHB-800]
MIDTSISAPTIPGYRITELIKVSTKTSIYRGIQEDTENPVIIKIINAEYPHFSDLIGLKNQLSLTQNISHPNIIKTYKLEQYRKGYALILEDFGGITLNQYANSQPLSLDDFFYIAIEITYALECLYKNRIIHKDIKPKNILINPKNKQIKIIDFSISSVLPKEIAEIKPVNVLAGTLAYMAPEQTGRMNRGIDYRTDYYSLGVTFYELLTGHLPFDNRNPLELIYCHLAKKPKNPREYHPEIPPPVAEIILKLMSKTAEERYQTARGIRHDLELCQEMWLHQGEIRQFKLAQKDRSDRFLIPEKLYGREAEVTALLSAFDNVSQGHKELMLVAGFSGIGKTAVVQEVHKPIARQNGYFIAGKYDQFQRNIPFSALLQAFRGLIKQLLTESTFQLLDWKNKILSALGNQGQVIIDVIPELEKIIDKQPPVPELAGNAAQNRFNLLFNQFIQIFATAEHPLVIFLDDLQWVDTASLKLIQLLMSEAETKYLLLIGAYRDNEVDTGHPLMMALNQLHQLPTVINQISLPPLAANHLQHLLSDTLACQPSQITELTELVLQTTQGNPFFTTQLLKSLHEEGLITYDFYLGHWQCNIEETKALYQNDDVVQFLTTQLNKLPQSTQNILKIAACLGNEFDAHTLAIVCETSPINTASDLWPALQEGLIIPQNDNYKLFTDANIQLADIGNIPVDLKTELEIDVCEELNVRYKFLHDRVQQAAYSLIPELEKKHTHLKIGQLLFSHTQSSELTENIFEIVNQLNMGVDLITNQNEKNQLSKLNLIAGRKAKSATAYEAAVRYFQVGLKLLSGDSWQKQYELTLDLYVEAVEAEYLNINFEQAAIYIDTVKVNAKSLLDSIKVYELKMQMYMAQLQMQLAIDTGLQLLAILGIDLETGLPANLNNLNIEDLINLPTLKEADKLAAMRMLIRMSAAAYFVNPGLVLPIIYTMIHISVKYGNSSASAYAYVVYGLLLCGALSDINGGYRYGQLALNLLEKFDARDIKFKVLFFWYSTIRCWKKHIRESILPLQENVRSGLEVGDLEYVGYCSTNHYFNLLFAGENLNQVFQLLEQYTALMEQLKQQWSVDNQKMWKQLVLNLLEPTPENGKLQGVFVNHELLTNFIETNNYNSLFNFYLAQLILFYLFNQPKAAVNSAKLGKPYTASVTGQILVSQHNFYYSLSLLAEYPQLSPQEQEAQIQEILANQAEMKMWAEHAPMNYQHKYDLIAAELAKLSGDSWQAVELYEQAIAGARANKYLQEEAIANELAALFFLASGKMKIAQTYLIDAYYCYLNWGAKAKVELLETSYPQLLAPIFTQKQLNWHNPHASTVISNGTSDSSHVFNMLDVETVTKAALAISSEIHLDKLIQTLMQVILENVGAQKAGLILSQGGELILVAHCIHEQVCTLQRTALQTSQEVPVSIINYVAHTQEHVFINDARIDQNFGIDPYIQQEKPKSILCNPIIKQGKLIGIVYLENNLTVGAFTPERLQVLKMLAAQAAISLENAQLYANLEEKVEQRTQELNEKNLRLKQAFGELKRTQTQLIQTEKMSSLGQMVAGIAHEINNPVNFIYGNIDPAHHYINSLLDLLALYEQEYPHPSAKIQAMKEDIDLEFLIVDLQKILTSMRSGADRICNIVVSLRNFSRLDEAQMKSVDIHQGIDSTLLILQHRLQPRIDLPGIEIIKEYSELPLVECYAGQLNQALMNIISNAIDALIQRDEERSPAEIQAQPSQIRIRTQVKNQQFVRIMIKDNGPGVKEEERARLFDPFFTTKPIGQGTGLGLAISYQIVVEQHGGNIECISSPGKGAEFVIDIPWRQRT